MHKHKSPASRSPSTRAFVSLAELIITKYFKQEFNGDLSVRVDERRPSGLSITGDIKIYQCHVTKKSWCCYSHWISALWTSAKELFSLPKLITVGPETRDKVMWIWGNDVSSFWGGVPNRTLRMRFTLLTGDT